MFTPAKFDEFQKSKPTDNGKNNKRFNRTTIKYADIYQNSKKSHIIFKVIPIK